LSHFLISVLPWPIFSASGICTGLFVLNPGSAIFLSVVEALTVEAQVRVPVARHCCSSCLYCRTPPFFPKGNVVVACRVLIRETFYSLFDLCMIHGHGAGFRRNRCAPV
jgi:hypothetical protein